MSDLIPKTTRDRLAKLEGLVSDETGLKLASLAALVPANQVIVELGSYRGKSGCYLAEGAKRGLGATVWCVDAWGLEGNIEGRYGFTTKETESTFDAQVAKMGLKVEKVKAFAADFGREWPGIIGSGPVGMIFIDSHHVYEAVKADFLAWEPWLAPGAIVAFDDAHHTRKCNRGVEVFVRELQEDTELWESWTFEPAPLAIGRRRK